MTGIDRADWNALEAGWVPSKNEHLLRSLAGTLQIDYNALVNAITPLEADCGNSGIKSDRAEEISVVKVAVPMATANLDGQLRRGQLGLPSNPLGHRFHGG